MSGIVSNIIFIASFLIMIVLDIVLMGVISFENKRYKGLLMSCSASSALVAGTYMLSVISETYFQVSLFSSLYFVCIDMLLFSLTHYILFFVQKRVHRHMQIYCIASFALIVIDSICLMINPFYEFEIHYVYDEAAFAHWRYQAELGYNLHLLLSYFFVATIVINLIIKIAKSPRVYRRKYYPIVLVVVLVVAMNALFLFLPGNGMFDFSILFYSVGCFIFFWMNNHYSEKGMLTEVRELVLNELGHPIVVFDNEDYYTMSNAKMDDIFPSLKAERNITLEDFVRKSGFESHLPNLTENHSFQWEYIDDKKPVLYRCDFSILRDNKGKAIGRMFMLADYSLEYDLLTTFHTENSFKQDFEYAERKIVYPAGVGICDINCLSVINRDRGHEMGDRSIKYLAQIIRKNTPEKSYYARLNDATLLFICFDTDSRSMSEYMNQIKADLADFPEENVTLSMQHAISMASENKPSIIDAMHQAMKSMRARKMMDASSAHSSLLDSLAQTLQESDSCTRQHVKRTQIMGEKLGIRLGLSDIELSNLALLCLLHDIGKLGVPLEILNKPGKLNNAEWEVMKSHSEKGYRIAKASKELEDIAELILHHHECWDGSGYPDGLTQEAIPMLSRIIAVVDTYDAMTNDRPYRKRLTNAQACSELTRCAGTQFDPFIVSEFVELLKEDGLYDYVEEEDQEEKQEEIVMPMGLEKEEVISDNLLSAVTYTRYILDGNNKILTIDDEFTQLTGYTEEDIEQYNLNQFDLIFPEDKKEYTKMVQYMLKTVQEAYIEHRLRRKDGTSRSVLCYGRQFFDSVSRQPRVQILCSDIATTDSAKQMISDAKDRANRGMKSWEDRIRRDVLTGVLNRTAFQNDVQMKLLDHDEKLVMLMCDVDYFKYFNDSMGHKKGDEFLIVFANSLKNHVDKYGLACRMGGDEFAAMLCFDPEETEERIREHMKYVWENVTQDIQSFYDSATASMGAFILPDNITNFNEAYKLADAALYKAKENGRDQIVIEG